MTTLGGPVAESQKGQERRPFSTLEENLPGALSTIIAFHVSAYLLMLLGLVHALRTWPYWDAFSPDAAWFAGAGLAPESLGALSMAAILSADRTVPNLCVLANSTNMVLGALFLLAVPEIQAVVAVIVFLAITLASPSVRFTQCSGRWWRRLQQVRDRGTAGRVGIPGYSGDGMVSVRVPG